MIEYVQSTFPKFAEPLCTYDYILNLGLSKDGQRVLDLGTGTGVLPRNMYKYGAKWTGTYIADNQIQQAKELH